METGVPQNILAEGGTAIYFNDLADSHGQGGFIQITRITGGDGANVRAPVDDRPQRDGGIVHPFYRGARYFTLEGLIAADSRNERTVIEDSIRGVTQKMLRADGRYIFTPSGQATRFITSRLAGPIDIQEGDGMMKTFSIPLVSEEPVAYSLTQTLTTIEDGGSQTITNHGNAESWPVLKVHGPYTLFNAWNDETGEKIQYAGTILSSHYVEIIMFRETVYLDGDGANKLGAIDFEATDFWTLPPGPSSIRFTSDSGSATMDVLSNDAWV